jgi:tetratricopeptide (TPR) repeat protein
VKTEAKGGDFPKIVTAGQDLERALKKDLQNLEMVLEKARPTPEREEGSRKKSNRILYTALALGLATFGAVWAFGLKAKLLPVFNKEAIHRSSVESLEKPASLKYGLSQGTQKGTDRIAAAKAFLSKATELVEKNPREAKSLLLKATESDPENAQAYFQLGLTYTALKNSPKAIEAYQKSIQLDPKFPGAYFNLGYVYAMDKSYSKAEEYYSQVVKMAPSYLDEALFNLALAQEKQGKRKKSIENLERALQVNPKNEMAPKLLHKLKVSS